MYVDSIDSSFDSYDIFNEKWATQIPPKFVENEFLLTVAPRRIQDIQYFIQKKQIEMKTFGNGSYEASVEKDSDGKSSASGSISYESDNGTKVEVEGRIDNEGNASGKVSIGGKF